MAKLTFKSLKFEQKQDFVRVRLYGLFYFDIPKSDLAKVDSEFKISGPSIDFPFINMAIAERKFNFLIGKYMGSLKNKLNNKPTVYVHSNSGIPLIGSNVFGIVDRNTSIIEVKPITGCNLDCIYCSVDEGKSSKKSRDFVVEKEYLVDELKKLIKFKGINGIEVHIGTQGEPLLYEPLLEFVKDIKKIKQVKIISINTNGLLFTEKSIDKFIKSGLNQINLSVNTLDKKKATKIANSPYDVDHIIRIAKYIANYGANRVDLRIAPVLMKSINEKDIEDLVVFAKTIGAKLGIQNYLYYPKGRKPCKQLQWPKFFDILKKLEKKQGVHLILDENDFNIKKTKLLPKPFKTRDIIDALVKCRGRYKNEFIGVSKDRNITIFSKKDLKIGSIVKVKIKRSKHNVFSSVI